MKNLAKNTTANEKVFNAVKGLLKNRDASVSIFPCYEDECDEVDLIYIDNGCKECYTLNKEKSNDPDFPIVFCLDVNTYYDENPVIKMMANNYTTWLESIKF